MKVVKKVNGIKLSDTKYYSLIWGKTDMHLRAALQQEKVPFGYAVKYEGSTQYTYHINERDLREYIGEEAWQEGLLRVQEYTKEQKEKSS